MKRGFVLVAGLAVMTGVAGLLTRPLVHSLRADKVTADLGIRSAPSERARIVDEHVLDGIESYAFGRELRLRLDRPPRRVRLEPFYIDRCEVRQIDFERFVKWHEARNGLSRATPDSPLPDRRSGALASASTGHRIAGLLRSPATASIFSPRPCIARRWGTPALGGRARSRGRRQGGTALRLGRHLRSGGLALPRPRPQRGPALRLPPVLGFAARGARPQRQRDGMERGQPCGGGGCPAAGRPAPGGTRCARGPPPRPCALRAQRGVASHRAGHPQPPPRLPLRVRFPASRGTALGRQGGPARLDRGRRVPDRPPARGASGTARGDPARRAVARCARPARLGRTRPPPDRGGAVRGEPPRVRGVSERSPRPFRALREPAGTGGRGLRPGRLGTAVGRSRSPGVRHELVGGGRLRALGRGAPAAGEGMAVAGGGPGGAALSLGQTGTIPRRRSPPISRNPACGPAPPRSSAT